MSGEKRERDVPAGAKAAGRKRSEHPLNQFSRSMRDFKGGIADLRRATEQLGKTKEGKASTYTGKPKSDLPHSFSQKLPKVAQSLRKPAHSLAPKAGQRPLPELKQHSPIHRKFPSQTPQVTGVTPRLPYHIPGHRTTSPLRENVVWKHVYGPEDKEAVQHLTEGASTGSFEDLPRAARVAMILRADEIAKETGQSDRVVHLLASAARSGRPEVAANFSPKRLEQVLGRLLGGRQQALQALWTPEVSKMVERYQTEREVVRERLQAAERHLSEGDLGKKGPESLELPLPVSGRASSSVPARTGSQAPAPMRGENKTLEALFQRNDMLHLSRHAENRRQEILNQAATGSRPHSMSPAPSPAGASSPELMLPSSSAPARRGGSPPTMTERERDRSDDRRKLEGRLTLMSTNGEAIGAAILDGSDTHG